MPTFELNKLVRDKLPAIYESLGQKALVKKLSKKEHSRALLQKMIEEIEELLAKKTIDIDELADIQQAFDDLLVLHGISKEELQQAQGKKTKKVGAFLAGWFVKRLTLRDDDKWVEYYRQEPNRFKELEDEKYAS